MIVGILKPSLRVQTFFFPQYLWCYFPQSPGISVYSSVRKEERGKRYHFSASVQTEVKRKVHFGEKTERREALWWANSEPRAKCLCMNELLLYCRKGCQDEVLHRACPNLVCRVWKEPGTVPHVSRLVLGAPQAVAPFAQRLAGPADGFFHAAASRAGRGRCPGFDPNCEG